MRIRNCIFRVTALALVASGSALAQRAPVKLPGRPEVPPPAAPVYPKVTYDSLANGLRFAIVEHHELPLVVVQTAVAGAGPFGAWSIDDPARPGAWGVVLGSLREGTTSRTNAQITDELLDLGTDMRFASSLAFVTPSFRAARSTWLGSLDILADVMIRPSFPAAGVARAQSAVAQAMERLPAVTAANRVMMTGLFGPESPHTRYASSAAVRALTHEDVVAMHQAYMRPQNTMLVVAGDVSVAEARAALTKAFGAWARGGTTIVPSVPAPATPAAATIFLKDAPGLTTAYIVGAQVLPGHDSPDATAIEVLASLIGDFSFSYGSRVYNAFRIERGLSYSPGINLLSRPAPEVLPFYSTIVTPAALADTAVNVLLNVLREVRGDKPPTASELDFSKRALVGRLASDLERVDALAASVLAGMRDGLPADEVNRWVGRMNAVTLPEVQAAARKYLDPDHLVIAVVADRSKVEAALRATGIPVVIVP